MRLRTVVGVIVAALALAGQALAAGDPLIEHAEKLQLKPHRVKGLLLGYGYDLGEYSGEVRSQAKSVRGPLFSSDKAKSVFTIASPRWPTPVTVTCGGGENRLGLGWIDFKRQDLTYVCGFEGGPAGAAFALALNDAPLMAKLYQPQRAAELSFGGTTLRAVTRKVEGAMPFGGGRTLSYRISKGDQEVAGLVRGVLQPTFYLPPAGDPDRDAAAVMALTLAFFQDPSDQQ